MTQTRAQPPVEKYDEAFCRESVVAYPRIEEFEAECGFAIDERRLQDAARILACPVKVNPPNWQHGRVIYSALRQYIARNTPVRTPLRCLDIGTAKGFSALCARWAIADAGILGGVTSVDVIDPKERTYRNTVADKDGPSTLSEILRAWPAERDSIAFKQATGVSWLTMNRQPIDFAFVDGKHNYQTVSEEIKLLADSQLVGAIAVFDDAQIPGVRRAVGESEDYQVSFLEALPNRVYGIATRI